MQDQNCKQNNDDTLDDPSMAGSFFLITATSCHTEVLQTSKGRITSSLKISVMKSFLRCLQIVINFFTGLSKVFRVGHFKEGIFNNENKHRELKLVPVGIYNPTILSFNHQTMRSFLPKPTGNANPITGLPNFQTAYNGVCKTSLNNFVQKLKIAIGRIIAVFFILIFAAAFSENIFAQTAGPNLAGAGATSGGTGTGWSNPDRVTANDNSYTSVSGTGTAFSEGLQATNFGFSIPAAATITGIQVTIGRYQSTGSGTADIQDNAVSLIQGGTVGGSNRGATSPTGNVRRSSDIWHNDRFVGSYVDPSPNKCIKFWGGT